MRKSKEFISMPVISLAEGQQIGIVKALVINPLLKSITALMVEQKGWFKEQKYIPYSKVRSVGNDVLTIEYKSSLDKTVGLPEIMDLLKNKVDIIGAQLITENGTSLGYVDEYDVEPKTGNIVGLEFSSSAFNSWTHGNAFLSIDYVLTIGKRIIICKKEATEHIMKMDGGIQETIKELKESTSQIWYQTIQKTKGLSKTRDKIKIDKNTGQQTPSKPMYPQPDSMMPQNMSSLKTPQKNETIYHSQNPTSEAIAQDSLSNEEISSEKL